MLDYFFLYNGQTETQFFYAFLQVPFGEQFDISSGKLVHGIDFVDGPVRERERERERERGREREVERCMFFSSIFKLQFFIFGFHVKNLTQNLSQCQSINIMLYYGHVTDFLITHKNILCGENHRERDTCIEQRQI